MIRRACVAMVVLAISFVPATLAEDEEEHDLKHFVFRGYFSWLSVGGEATNFGEATEIQGGSICLLNNDCFAISMGEGSGFQANFEFRATQLIGVEIGGTTHDVDGQLFLNVQEGSEFYNVGGGFNPEVTTDMAYVGINFHVWKKGSALDVYLGPFYADVSYDDAKIATAGTPMMPAGRNLAIIYDDESTWGLNGAFDIGIGKHWFVSASLRYVASEPDAVLYDVDDPGLYIPFEFKINPFIFSVGGGIRF